MINKIIEIIIYVVGTFLICAGPLSILYYKIKRFYYWKILTPKWKGVELFYNGHKLGTITKVIDKTTIEFENKEALNGKSTKQN